MPTTEPRAENEPFRSIQVSEVEKEEKLVRREEIPRVEKTVGIRLRRGAGRPWLGGAAGDVARPRRHQFTALLQRIAAAHDGGSAEMLNW